MKSSIAFFLSGYWCSSACLFSLSFFFSAQASPALLDLREFQSRFVVSNVRNKIVLDRSRLKNSIREIVSSMQISPIFGTEIEHQGRPYLRVIATSDSSVWSAVKMDALASVHCLGKMIDTEDERLDDFDNALLNGQSLVAYTTTSMTSTPSREEIEVIMKSQGALFRVKRSAVNSFFIEKLGYIQK